MPKALFEGTEFDHEYGCSKSTTKSYGSPVTKKDGIGQYLKCQADTKSGSTRSRTWPVTRLRVSIIATKILK